MAKLIFNLLLAVFFGVFVYLMIPADISYEDIVAAYSDYDPMNTENAAFDKNLFADYQQIIIQEQEKESSEVSSSNNESNVITLDLAQTTSQIIQEIESSKDISAKRKATVLKGMELVGFTRYRLGAKVAKDQKNKPAYLDCSGFVQWTLIRAVDYEIGHGTAHQYDISKKIEEKDLMIGDLGFKKPGGVQNLGGGNHVGIFVGYDKGGQKLWLHCTSGKQNGVGVSNHSGLVYYTRPKCY